VGLDTIRDITRPWYESSPPIITILFAVVMVCISYGIFQYLFVMPPKKPEALGGSRPTTVIFNGNTIQQLTVVASGSSQSAAPQPAVDTIVENGGFEQGTAAWGTGWFEGLFMRPAGEALSFNRAVARWYIDNRRARNDGGRALRIEHDSPYAPHVFSSFSQRIKLKPSQRYEVKFWVYLEGHDQGSFSLRVLPSRATAPAEWDRFKVKPNSSVQDRWQEVRKEFESGADWFFDLRFAAEAPLRAWVDDVSVTPIGEMREMGSRQPPDTKK
jgi:hypothetical protein